MLLGRHPRMNIRCSATFDELASAARRWGALCVLPEVSHPGASRPLSLRATHPMEGIFVRRLFETVSLRAPPSGWRRQGRHADYSEGCRVTNSEARRNGQSNL